MELKDSYNKSDAHMLHSSSWSNSGELGVVFGRIGVDNDQGSIHQPSYWKGMNIMKVQVDMEIEIQSDSWGETEIEGFKTTIQIERGRRE